MTGLIVLGGCAAAFAAAGFYQGLKKVTYRVESPKITGRVRLLLLSDLHGMRWGDKQERLIRLAQAARPDAVLLAGDIADASHGFLAAEELAQGLVPLAPVYFVTGNHDLLTFDCGRLKQTLREIGVTVLEDETRALQAGQNTLMISGLDELLMGFIKGRKDRAAFYRERLASLLPLDAKAFNLLLAHRPEYVDDYQQAGFDLALCGHTHGGQIRLPGVMNGLYVSGQGFFPKYAGGLYRRGSFTQIVGRGLHVSLLRPRFYNRPEAVIVELTGEGYDAAL